MNSQGHYSFASPPDDNYMRDDKQVNSTSPLRGDGVNPNHSSYNNYSNGSDNDRKFVEGGRSDNASGVYPTSVVSNSNDTHVSSSSIPPAHPPMSSANTVGGGIPKTMDSNESAYLYANPMKDEETEDGRVRNQEAATKIKDAWIYKQILARQVSVIF